MEMRMINADESNLVVNLFDKYRVFYKQASDIALAQQFIQARLDNNESVIFVALDGDVPVGFTQLYPKYSSARATRNWILNDLFVEETYRKQGIGEKLIVKAIAFGKDTGATFVQLETAKDNFTAQSLYRAVGFIEQPYSDEFLVFRIAIS